MAPREGAAPEDEARVQGHIGAGFLHYPTHRDHPLKTSRLWITGKQHDDAVGRYWRVHDHLYDLTAFIDKHPGGRDWLEVTQGTDITEAFESSHIGGTAERILAQYRVGPAEGPRNSPYTFHQDGFFKTFKRKVRPILQKVGTGPTRSMLLLQDMLATVTLATALAACVSESYVFAALSGVFLSFTGSCAHNFFHQKDNWRMYLFDLTLLSSYDWRISHGLSHHLFTNTFYDFEISMLEPFFEFLPKPNKSLLQRYGSYVYEIGLLPIAMYLEALKRVWFVSTRQHPLRLENLLPVLELLVMWKLSSSFYTALKLWLVIHSACSSWFVGVGLVVAHHHPDIYHQGDTTRTDPDWGLCQLDAVRDRIEVKGNLFLVSTTFGDHSLHHLLPTVDHSKLHHVYPVFLETCREFNIPFEFVNAWDLVVGAYLQLARTKPNPHPPGYKQR